MSNPHHCIGWQTRHSPRSWGHDYLKSRDLDFKSALYLEGKSMYPCDCHHWSITHWFPWTNQCLILEMYVWQYYDIIQGFSSLKQSKSCSIEKASAFDIYIFLPTGKIGRIVNGNGRLCTCRSWACLLGRHFDVKFGLVWQILWQIYWNVWKQPATSVLAGLAWRRCGSLLKLQSTQF